MCLASKEMREGLSRWEETVDCSSLILVVKIKSWGRGWNWSLLSLELPLSKQVQPGFGHGVLLQESLPASAQKLGAVL